MRDQIKVLKALSSESRLKILLLLQEHPHCVNAITTRFSMTQAAVSQHLRVLKEAGLVLADKRGYWMHYRIDQEALKHHLEAVAELFRARAKSQNAGSGARNCPPKLLKECKGKVIDHKTGVRRGRPSR